MKIKALSKQSLFDLAIQTSGSVTATIKLALAYDLSITDELSPGQEITIVDVANADIKNYYTNKQLTPATAITGTGIFKASGVFNKIFDKEFL